MPSQKVASDVSDNVRAVTTTLLGYARVSTTDQDLALQLDALERAGVDPNQVWTDKASGASTDRPGLTALLDYARTGDVLVVWKLDRLGRSVRQVVDFVDELGRRGIGLRSLTESIDTTTAQGTFIFHLFAALAELERGMIRERTLAGLTAARERGRVGGRPTVWTPERAKAAEAMLRGGADAKAISAALGVSTSSTYRWLASRS